MTLSEKIFILINKIEQLENDFETKLEPSNFRSVAIFYKNFSSVYQQANVLNHLLNGKPMSDFEKYEQIKSVHPEIFIPSEMELAANSEITLAFIRRVFSLAEKANQACQQHETSEDLLAIRFTLELFLEEFSQSDDGAARSSTSTPGFDTNARAASPNQTAPDEGISFITHRGFFM